MNKICSRCKNKNRQYSLTRSGVLGKVCDKCNAQQKTYLDNNRSKYNEYAKKSHLKRKDKVKLTTKKYREKNKESIEKYAKEYREKNTEKVRKAVRQWYYKVKKPFIQTPEGKYKTYRDAAKRQNRDFNLSFEEFMSLWQKPCFYCNDSILTIGIDRVDNDKGYIIDNIKPCCTLCNWMKRSFPEEIFINQCCKIASKINHH